jgi:hypothetical protein
LEGLGTENFDIFYDRLEYFTGHLEYFTAIWYNLWPFGIFYSFGMFVRKKSGNLGLGAVKIDRVCSIARAGESKKEEKNGKMSKLAVA